MRASIAALIAVPLLAACGSDSASYMVNGDRDTAFSLFRDKAFFGRPWHVEVVVTHMPECQRRYTLRDASGGEPYKTSLYRDADGNYFLHASETWYQGRLEGCRLQPVPSAPPSPGALVGTWEDRGEGLKFYSANGASGK